MDFSLKGKISEIEIELILFFKRNSDWIDQVILVAFEKRRQEIRRREAEEEKQRKEEAKRAYEFRDMETQM